MIDMKHRNMIFYIYNGNLIFHCTTNGKLIAPTFGDRIVIDNEEYVINEIYNGPITSLNDHNSTNQLDKNITIIFLSDFSKKNQNQMNKRLDDHNQWIVVLNDAETGVQVHKYVATDADVRDKMPGLVDLATKNNHPQITIPDGREFVQCGALVDWETRVLTIKVKEIRSEHELSFTKEKRLRIYDIFSGEIIPADSCQFDKPVADYQRGDIIYNPDIQCNDYHVLSVIVEDDKITIFVSIYPITKTIHGVNVMESIFDRFVIGMDKNPYDIDQKSRYIVVTTSLLISNCEIAKCLGKTKSGDIVWVDENGNMITDEVIAYRIL